MGSCGRAPAGKRRLAGDRAGGDQPRDLRREAPALKEVVAEQALELRLLKKTYDPPRLQVIFSRAPK